MRDAERFQFIYSNIFCGMPQSLIDWDGAMIADPAIDLGPLLYHYVEEEN
ncbi:MAG: hypothetical protein KZY76_00390 [Bacillus sp. (in: Bacteria)]|nr:hypothetical protein [Bacillus sp. (in: firmicutes)]MBW4884120.1 hypothetical protein [Bacillus sp. (in: firmicutes)]